MSAVLRDSAVVQRVPPQSVDSEQCVLGGLMLAPDALASLALDGEDFYRRDHRQIFRAIQELDGTGKPFDAVTLGEWFESNGLSEQVAGGAYLTELATTIPSAANIHAHAAIVRDKAVLRRMIEVGTEVVNSGFDPDGRESAELVDNGVAALMALQRQQSRHEFSLRDAVNSAMADMQEAFQSEGKLRGVPSGFGRLDARLGGFHRGDLIFIGARPKMGKTALMVNMAYNAAKAGHPVGIISGEQSAMQLAQRFLALETAIAGERMRNGQLEDEDWAKLTAAIRNLLQRKVHIYDAGGPEISVVRRLARKWKKEHGISALYVDYLQRLRCRQADGRTEEVGEVARCLKDIARENDIAVISLAQVKREVETRQDKRPTAADIANSDEATREADQILMLYRDSVYNPNARKGTAELTLEANRHGPTGLFDLAWLETSMRFGDLADDWS